MPTQESKHSKNILQSGDFLVMVTDGVLEYLHVKGQTGETYGYHRRRQK